MVTNATISVSRVVLFSVAAPLSQMIKKVTNPEDMFSSNTTDMRQSETLLTIDERGYKSLKTVFSSVISRQSGDKWQSKTLFLKMFELRSSIVLMIFLLPFIRCEQRG